MASGNTLSESSAWLVREWSARLAEVLESMGGSRPQATWRLVAGTAPQAAAALPPESGVVLWWEQSFSAAAGACFSVGAPEASWTTLGQHVLTAAGIEGAEAAEARSTFLELAGQSLESVANAVGARLGREVVCPARTEKPGPPAAGECFVVEVTLEGAAPLLLLAVPGPELAATLSPQARQPGNAGEAQPAGAADAHAATPGGSQMLDLLLDVELPVSISFGRTQLALREALKLTTGSIVELNRTVSEPVEVIVNNCVIARGEVVVIEGNYGVRIREIMSREARLNNLR